MAADEFTETGTAAANTATPPVTAARVGRNDACPCGSGKKFKKCCINEAAYNVPVEAKAATSAVAAPKTVANAGRPAANKVSARPSKAPMGAKTSTKRKV
jgi:hypothetical protein